MHGQAFPLSAALQEAPSSPVQDGPGGRSASAAVKAISDRSLALIALLLLLPLLLLIACLVCLDSPGPALFSQARHGRYGALFKIRKFRTLRWEGEVDGRDQVRRRDSRVTRVGGFLRRTSLDELPQLWNVLMGSMSLVGPRPHPIGMRTEGMLCEEILPDYGDRLLMKPGLTGLAQINGHRGPASTVADLEARLADDLRYIAEWSLLLDLRIVLLTPYRLILQRERAF